MIGDILLAANIYIVTVSKCFSASQTISFCYIKRLNVVQGRQRWSRYKSEVKSVTWQQLDWLMSGFDIEQSKLFKPFESLDLDKLKKNILKKYVDFCNIFL